MWHDFDGRRYAGGWPDLIESRQPLIIGGRTRSSARDGCDHWRAARIAAASSAGVGGIEALLVFRPYRAPKAEPWPVDLHDGSVRSGTAGDISRLG